MKPKVIQLVDSIEYINSNCFQHQLLYALKQKADVVQVKVADLHSSKLPSNTSHVISCLKMRTVHRVLNSIKSYLQNCPLVMYEQDPWHGYMDDSEYKGIFERVNHDINLGFVAVTTRWWAQYMQLVHNIPTRFVKMWMLPSYCSKNLDFVDRSISLGFVGSVHSYRQKLFDQLSVLGYPVRTFGGYDYQSYLNLLQNIKIYVHSEDHQFTINQIPHNLNDGLWAREIEVGARGCISIRNWGVEHSSYIDENIKNTFLYKDVKDIPNIIDSILNMDQLELQERIDSTISYIRDSDEWNKTADILIKG